MITLLSQHILPYPSRSLFLAFALTLGAAWILVSGLLTPISLLVCLMFAPAILLALLYPRQAFLSVLIIRNVVDVFSDAPILLLGGFSLNLSSLLGVLMIGWGLWYFFSYWPIPIYRGNFSLVLFIATVVLSVFGSLQPMRSVQEVIKFTNLALVFIFAYDYVRSRRDFQTIISVLGAAIFVPAVLGIVQLLSGTGLSNEIENRIFGTYGHPNVFAFALGLSIIIWIGVTVVRTSPDFAGFLDRQFQQAKIVAFVQRIPLWSIFSLLTLLLVFTYTRGAWIGIIVSLFLIGIRYARKKTLISIGLAVLSFALFPYLNQTIQRTTGYHLTESQLMRRLSTDDEDASSWHWRLRSWQEVSVRFNNMPLFGYGIGTFQQIRESTVSYPYDLKLEAHNDYLRLALEAGFLGLFGYLVFLASIVVRCLIASWSLPSPAIRRICFITASATISFLVMSISDNILHATAVDWLWWALMGATCALISNEQARAYAYVR